MTLRSTVNPDKVNLSLVEGAEVSALSSILLSLKQQIEDVKKSVSPPEVRNSGATGVLSPGIPHPESDGAKMGASCSIVKDSAAVLDEKGETKRVVRRDFIKLNKFDGTTPLETFLIHLTNCA